MCVGMCCVDVLCVVHVTTVVHAFSINNVETMVLSNSITI